ncbi:MAG: MFS transporter [Thermoguttaceae bacterium]|nr:MFS transporter [Thermoguttaceae bacterium]
MTSAPDPNANRRRTPSDDAEIYSATPTSEPASPVRYRSFGCPRCRTRLFATKADVGKIVVCPDCDEKIVVPDYLDFETETDYERFNNPQKRRQDELLSPARNPNRVGIDVDGADIYGVKGKVDATVKTGSDEAGETPSETASEEKKGKGEPVFYPVRCRVCETLTQAPAELLGKTVRCPDCGTETVVTAALKEQFATTDVRFQPRDRGVYELGEIPEAPDRVYQRFDGKTVFVPNSAKTIAPSPPKKPDASAKYSDKRKNRQGSASQEGGATGLSAVAKPKRRSSREERERLRRLEEMKAEFGAVAVGEALRTTRNDSTETTGERRNVGALGENPELDRTLAILTVLTSPIRTLKRFWSRLATPPEIEDPTAFLPPLVLRYRNGEAIWTRPAPPRRFPLFNRTFQALATNELWARAGTVVLIGLALTVYVLYSLAPTVAAQGSGGPLEKFEFLVLTIFAFPTALFWTYWTASFFEAIFGAGASGARRVLSWRDDDRLDGLLYALWFVALVGAAFSPGVALGGAFGWFENGEETAEALSGLQLVDLRIAATLAGSFSVCFPIFYLSTLYTGWPFAPICGAVLASFLRRIVVWTQFWAVSAALVFAPLALGIRYFKTTTFWWAAPFALVVLTALYALLLGRLAWILDEDERSLDYDD